METETFKTASEMKLDSVLAQAIDVLPDHLSAEEVKKELLDCISDLQHVYSQVPSSNPKKLTGTNFKWLWTKLDELALTVLKDNNYIRNVIISAENDLSFFKERMVRISTYERDVIMGFPIFLRIVLADTDKNKFNNHVVENVKKATGSALLLFQKMIKYACSILYDPSGKSVDQSDHIYIMSNEALQYALLFLNDQKHCAQRLTFIYEAIGNHLNGKDNILPNYSGEKINNDRESKRRKLLDDTSNKIISNSEAVEVASKLLQPSSSVTVPSLLSASSVVESSSSEQKNDQKEPEKKQQQEQQQQLKNVVDEEDDGNYEEYAPPKDSKIMKKIREQKKRQYDELEQKVKTKFNQLKQDASKLKKLKNKIQKKKQRVLSDNDEDEEDVSSVAASSSASNKKKVGGGIVALTKKEKGQLPNPVPVTKKKIQNQIPPTKKQKLTVETELTAPPHQKQLQKKQMTNQKSQQSTSQTHHLKKPQQMANNKKKQAVVVEEDDSVDSGSEDAFELSGDSSD